MSEALPRLTRGLVGSPGFAARTDPGPPGARLLELPEKAVQFGTGAFLRGFVEFFLDQANRRGTFGGRVVMIGSTGSGRDRVLADQDGLYTLRMQGLEGGEVRQENRLIGVVSRAIPANDQWGEVLECARNPQLELVFSNTTEVGITLDPDDRPDLDPPRSFPGKLTAFLLERGRAFDFGPEHAPTIVPCELIENNGDRLRNIVLELADRWALDRPFRRWIEDSVSFCNTLVDRIVPGTPEPDTLAALWEELGYRDELLTTSELYRLFVVQPDARTRRPLPFEGADAGVLVTDELAPYLERKVRLLNGTHTAMTPLALLSGCSSVQEALAHDQVGGFVRDVLFDELVPAVDVVGAEEYARSVLDRFANPFIRHALLDIMLQATMKMRVRLVPMIERHLERTGRVPDRLALGFAAHLCVLRDAELAGPAAALALPADKGADQIRTAWRDAPAADEPSLRTAVQRICADRSLWDRDLSELDGFATTVAGFVSTIVQQGVEKALSHRPGCPPGGAGAGRPPSRAAGGLPS